MLWIIGITLVVMVVYSFVAAEAERRGDAAGERSAQGAVSFGWIVLAAIVLFGGLRAC